MAVSSTLQYVADVVADLGDIRVKRMFGGAGLLCNDLMFALEAGGAVYFKADEVNRPIYEGAGSVPFSYEMSGKPRSMSYWSVPESAVDDPDEIRKLAVEALEAARRSDRRRKVGN
nr:TfoX/Sxy family protein [Hongsoonwoonella zoysiae]